VVNFPLGCGEPGFFIAVSTIANVHVLKTVLLVSPYRWHWDAGFYLHVTLLSL
jgi:hypothetical protein